MLTALGSPDNKITGFNVGADDYVLKPFDFRELLARVNVFLRRSDTTPKQEKLVLADLVMDTDTRTVTRAGKRIDLTVKEYAFLKLFLTALMPTIKPISGRPFATNAVLSWQWKVIAGLTSVAGELQSKPWMHIKPAKLPKYRHKWLLLLPGLTSYSRFQARKLI